VLGGLISFCMSPDPLSVFSKSQGRTVTLTHISTLKATGGAVVSIAADGPLYRAKTDQDGDTYRVLIANARVTDGLKVGSGASLKTAGDDVEIRVQVEPGTKVTSWAHSNRLNLSIDGQLMASSEATQKDHAQLDPNLRLNASPVPTNPVETKSNTNPEVKSAPASTSIPNDSAGKLMSFSDASVVSSAFSATSVFVVLGVGAFGLLGLYKLKSKQTSKDEVRDPVNQSYVQTPEPQTARVESEDTVVTQDDDSASKQLGQASTPVVETSPASSNTSALYGAYRVDQEVGKLILGQAHRLDVLASRSLDDRRAIETSLMKALVAGDAGEDARKRARQALEEYGFVARQCAALLLAPEAFERMTAARTLGQIESPIALPFLLEALYDGETIVRNQAIASIGELKLPSAIGALLDLARRNPDVPSALLSRSLSACSLEGLSFFSDRSTVTVSGAESQEVAKEPKPRSSIEIEELPEMLQDHGLARALADLRDAKESIRAQAIQELGQFRAHAAVQALVSVVRSGVNPGFRAMAISSLGMINHHCVFPAVLIGMADESREVRAAAARALNRLTFDRGDAYVHVLETASPDTIRDVAHACIQAGIVSQGIDRLASNDRRQAYEAFSLVSLLSRADMIEPVFEAMLNRPSLELRLSAAKLLATTKEPKVLERLRLMAMEDSVDEEVRAELLAALDQANEPGADDALPTRKELDKELESPSSSILETKTGKGES
jgi:HEAT repeat protein